MDVSAQTLREVEFREKLRGYHPDDVDEFLERVAAGVEYLQDRLRQATERAQRAESRATETHDGDDALKRTLVLAQRTAEMAVQEARQEADRIAASARAEANAIVAQAEDMARRTIEETQGGLRAELTQLEAARDRLRNDISSLERHLDQERLRLRASLAEALEVVEATLAPAAPAPDIADVPVPPVRVPRATFVEQPAPAPAPVAEPVNGHLSEPVAEPVNGHLGEPERFDIDFDAFDQLTDDAVSALEPALETEPPLQTPPAPAPSPPVESASVGLAVDGPFDDLADDSVADAPLTATPDAVLMPAWAAPAEEEPQPELEPAFEAAVEPAEPYNGQDEDDDEFEDEDPFIAELRRAITDTQPLGPREEGDVNPDSQDDALVHGDVLDSSRLGSLLRRRR